MNESEKRREPIPIDAGLRGDWIKGLTRDQLVARLAEVSHETWMRQAERDKGQRNLDPNVHPHDLERAEDTVRELERLGLFPSDREER